MKRTAPLFVLVVLANVLVIAWLLLRQPGEEVDTTGGLSSALLADNTMEAARYDLSDRENLNVVLVSMDALRYDATGLGGSSAGLTPNMDAFADEAVVFHNAVTAAPWTLPSHMSVWTARWPSVHGVTNKLKLLAQDQMVETSLSPGIQTYPDVLIQEGFVAGGFTGGAGVQGRYGFGRGFDTYLDDRYFGGTDYSLPAALEWLGNHRGERIFLFLHGYDAHGQFDLAEGARGSLEGYAGSLDGTIDEQARLREQGLDAIENPGDLASLEGVLDAADAAFLRQVYDQKVRQADERLGQFMGQLRSMGLLDNTVVALISDHGDEFMEHGGVDHGATLYEEQLHVVMAIRFPGYARRHDVQEVVRTVDLFPTIFDSMGVAGPTGVDGVSLLPLLRGQKLEVDAFAETDYRLFVHQRMIRQGNHKLILDLLDGGRELYDLSADPGEKKDLSSQDPRRTYEMEQALRRWMEATRTNPQDYLGVKQKPIEIF